MSVVSFWSDQITCFWQYFGHYCQWRQMVWRSVKLAFGTLVVHFLQWHEHVEQIDATHMFIIFFDYSRTVDTLICVCAFWSHPCTVVTGSKAACAEDRCTAELSNHLTTTKPELASTAISADPCPISFSSFSDFRMNPLNWLDRTVPTDQIPRVRSWIWSSRNVNQLSK